MLDDGAGPCEVGVLDTDAAERRVLDVLDPDDFPPQAAPRSGAQSSSGNTNAFRVARCAIAPELCPIEPSTNHVDH
ncbi:MAG: hypothetical protein WAU75_06755 [Solirubrobacteraceae bacterium]